MPSINEVWEQALQINANLVILHQDAQTLTTEVTDAHHELANELAAIRAGVDRSNAFLRYEVLQSRTIICLLDKIARQTCDLLTESAEQTEFQSRLADWVQEGTKILETVHPDAVLVLQRAAELRAQLERCCPPQKRERRCTFTPCPMPPELPATDDTRGRTSAESEVEIP